MFRGMIDGVTMEDIILYFRSRILEVDYKSKLVVGKRFVPFNSNEYRDFLYDKSLEVDYNIEGDFKSPFNQLTFDYKVFKEMDWHLTYVASAWDTGDPVIGDDIYTFLPITLYENIEDSKPKLEWLAKRAGNTRVSISNEFVRKFKTVFGRHWAGIGTSLSSFVGSNTCTSTDNLILYNIEKDDNKIIYLFLLWLPTSFLVHMTSRRYKSTKRGIRGELKREFQVFNVMEDQYTQMWYDIVKAYIDSFPSSYVNISYPEEPTLVNMPVVSISLKNVSKSVLLGTDNAVSCLKTLGMLWDLYITPIYIGDVETPNVNVSFNLTPYTFLYTVRGYIEEQIPKTMGYYFKRRGLSINAVLHK